MSLGDVGCTSIRQIRTPPDGPLLASGRGSNPPARSPGWRRSSHTDHCRNSLQPILSKAGHPLPVIVCHRRSRHIDCHDRSGGSRRPDPFRVESPAKMRFHGFHHGITAQCMPTLQTPYMGCIRFPLITSISRLSVDPLPLRSDDVVPSRSRKGAGVHDHWPRPCASFKGDRPSTPMEGPYGVAL